MDITPIENTCQSHSRRHSMVENEKEAPVIQSIQSFVEALRSDFDAEEDYESLKKLPVLGLENAQTDRLRLSVTETPSPLTPELFSDMSSLSYDNLSDLDTTIRTRSPRRITQNTCTQEEIANALLPSPWEESANCINHLETTVEKVPSSFEYSSTLLSQQEVDPFFQDSGIGSNYLSGQSPTREFRSVQEHVHRSRRKTSTRVRIRRPADPTSVYSNGWLSRQHTNPYAFQETEPVATNDPVPSSSGTFHGGHKHFPNSSRQLPGDHSFQPTDRLRQVTSSRGVQKQLINGTYASIFTEEMKLDTTQGTYTPALLRRIETANEENKEDILERHLHKIFAAIGQDIPKTNPEPTTEPTIALQRAQPSKPNSRCGAKWIWGKVWARSERRNGKFWTFLGSGRQSKTLGSSNTRIGV